MRLQLRRASADDDPRPKRLPGSERAPKTLRSDAFLSRAMESWGDVVYRVALAQTGSPSDADDVFQDVFMRLLESTKAFESDEHLEAWLLRVAVNRCHDLARSSWNRRTEGLESDLADQTDHADHAQPDAFQSDIWEVVGTLPFDLRAVVHLFYVEGYSTDEIARIARCRPATVRTRLHRAREQLRALMLPERSKMGEELTHGQSTCGQGAANPA